jgi:hypothetical protein
VWANSHSVLGITRWYGDPDGGDLPTVKQLVAIAIAIAMAIVGASAFGISAADHSATQVRASRITPAKADFRLDGHQRLRTMLLGRERIELPLR